MRIVRVQSSRGVEHGRRDSSVGGVTRCLISQIDWHTRHRGRDGPVLSRGELAQPGCDEGCGSCRLSSESKTTRVTKHRAARAKTQLVALHGGAAARGFGQKGGVDKNYRSNSCLPASSKENNLLSDPPGERTTSAGGSLLTAHLRAVLQTGFGVRDGGETLSAVGRVVHQIALRTFRVTLRSTTERGGALVASTHPFFSC